MRLSHFVLIIIFVDLLLQKRDFQCVFRKNQELTFNCNSTLTYKFLYHLYMMVLYKI